MGRRTLPLRAYDKDSGKEDGNFQYFIEWKSTFDPILAEHVSHCKRNATYLSTQVQNKFIECCGEEIRAKIVSACSQSKFFSVMADECQDISGISQLSICVRYLASLSISDAKVEPHEDFVGFINTERTDAQTVADAIVDNLIRWGFPMQNLRGQGYDGCSTMLTKSSV